MEGHLSLLLAIVFKFQVLIILEVEQKVRQNHFSLTKMYYFVKKTDFIMTNCFNPNIHHNLII